MQEVDPPELPRAAFELMNFIQPRRHRANDCNAAGDGPPKYEAIVPNRVLQPIQGEEEAAELHIMRRRPDVPMPPGENAVKPQAPAHFVDPVLRLRPPEGAAPQHPDHQEGKRDSAYGKKKSHEGNSRSYRGRRNTFLGPGLLNASLTLASPPAIFSPNPFRGMRRTMQKPASQVLVCDDEKNMRRVLEDILSEDGWEVTAVGTGEEAVKAAAAKRFEAIVLDLSLPGMNGLEVIDKLRDQGNESGLVVITAYGSIDVAVKAMQHGAVDFLIKPFDNSRIKAALRKIRETTGPLNDVEMSHPTVLGADNLPMNITGRDPRLTDIFRISRQIASLKTSVLISGESGTGKELVAQAIHYNGSRRHQPFVAINCAALPETLLESEFFGHERGAFTGAHAMVRGKFEVADHGTLFLDEVGDMPPSLQVKLLRVLQEQKFARVGGEKEITVDVRVIAATNRDLEEAVRLKQFREDLHYRLNVIPIQLPPLRERREDIPHLVEYFLNKFSKRHSLPKLRLTDEDLRALSSYSWPGNIRELQNSVEKATVLQDTGALAMLAFRGGISMPDSIKTGAAQAAAPRKVTDDEFPIDLGQAGSIRELNEVAADAQRAAVIRALKLCNGNKSEAAKKLGISYKTLFNKIDDLQIQISTNVE
ncbi:hypothetical protein BH09SUM1_BH09SUM1_14190 [soil metagenome]